jgi:hypothetical protein
LLTRFLVDDPSLSEHLDVEIWKFVDRVQDGLWTAVENGLDDNTTENNIYAGPSDRPGILTLHDMFKKFENRDISVLLWSSTIENHNFDAARLAKKALTNPNPLPPQVKLEDLKYTTFEHEWDHMPFKKKQFPLKEALQEIKVLKARLAAVKVLEAMRPGPLPGWMTWKRKDEMDRAQDEITALKQEIESYKIKRRQTPLEEAQEEVISLRRQLAWDNYISEVKENRTKTASEQLSNELEQIYCEGAEKEREKDLNWSEWQEAQILVQKLRKERDALPHKKRLAIMAANLQEAHNENAALRLEVEEMKHEREERDRNEAVRLQLQELGFQNQ